MILNKEAGGIWKSILFFVIPLALILLSGCDFFSDADSDNDVARNNGNDNSLDSILYEDSPFGVFTAYAGTEYADFKREMSFSDEDYYNWADNHMVDLGAHWTRSNLQLIWDKVEPEIGKGYVWDNELKTDSIVKQIYDSNGKVNWLGVFYEGDGNRNNSVGNYDSKKSGKPPLRNPAAYPLEYGAFVKAAVERYDGDGIDDASSNVKVKYWQVGNEVPGWSNSGRTLEEYANFVKLVSASAKSADPNAKIVLIADMDGQNVDPFIGKVIDILSSDKSSGKVFDAIDIHYWEAAPNWKLHVVKQYRELLDSKGLYDIQIWSCEHGTWVGNPSDNIIVQTEFDQASSMVKRYVYNLANGLDKLMWNNIIEWRNFNGRSDSMFNSMGLVADGAGKGEDSSMFNVPRLSYYSYKLMTKKLENSDWKNIQILNEENDIYAYKFVSKNESDVWVVWWEDGNNSLDSQKFVLDVGLLTGNVVVTQSIPKYTSGKYVLDFNEAIEYIIVPIVDGKVEITFSPGMGPMYVENYESRTFVGNKVLSFSSHQDYSRSNWKLQYLAQSSKPMQVNGLPRNVGPGLTNPKCGDGVCDQVEQANVNLCPVDCS